MSKKGCLHCGAVNPDQATNCHACGYSFHIQQSELSNHFNQYQEGFNAGFAEAVRMLRSDEAARKFFSNKEIAEWLEAQRSKE
jgi:transcription elongation factor Elf1